MYPGLYQHQQEDIARFRDATEIALFTEMGLGKTATVLYIAMHKFIKKDIDFLLYVAPNDVHRQVAVEQVPLWLHGKIDYEVQCFGGRGGAKKTHPFYRPKGTHLHILVVNIDTFSTPDKWRDIVEFSNTRKTFIVCDEATVLKNPAAKRTERMLYEFNDVVRRRKTIISSKPKTVARAILTGTPATNGVMDLWSLMEFLRPNYFGRNWHSFRNHYCMLAAITTSYGATQIMLTQSLWEGIKNCNNYGTAYAIFGITKDTYDTVQMQSHYKGAYKNEEELRELIAPVSVFRLLKDCVDMPPQTFNKKVVGMSDAQRQAYKDMESELLAMYRGAEASAANKLSALVRLAQISSGFIVQEKYNQYTPDEFELTMDELDVLPGEAVWLGKEIPKLEALYRDVEASSKPCIIITRFTCEAARIYEDLSKDYSCMLWTGWKKEGSMEEFKDGKYQVMVANIRCVSRGFNLQNASQMFFYSNTFSLEDRLQTEGRIFRIGQRLPTNYTDYITEGTIDLKVVGALRQKRALLDYIRGTSLTSFITEEDELTIGGYN